jgi:hypothetical protein
MHHQKIRVFANPNKDHQANTALIYPASTINDDFLNLPSQVASDQMTNTKGDHRCNQAKQNLASP